LIINDRPFQSAEIITDIISVYDSKSFPGANPPSDISRWFHKQGVMIGGGPYGRKIKPKN
jgi:hypothetical protein